MDRNIVITGASQGIGAETAKCICKAVKNANLFLIARNQAKLEQIQNELLLINSSNRVVLINESITDLTLDKINTYFDAYGSIDILINNAGKLIVKDFDQHTDEDWQEIFEVNFFSPMKLIRNCLPLLKRSKSAHIVNISTMGAFQGSSKFPGLAAYSSSKAALTNLTELLAEEFKPFNIRLNALAIGAVQTEMLQTAFPGYEAPVSPEQMGKYIAEFAINGHQVMNGKIIPLAVTTP